MEIKFWNQPKDVSLGNILNEKLKKGYQKVWLVAGVAKDDGIEVLMEGIEAARKLDTEVNILIGLDRKNISKDVLMHLLQLNCHLFLHINREENKVETRIYLFESKDGESYIYQSSGKMSESGLLSSYCTVQEISYPFSEKKAFENAKMNIIQISELFQETNEEELKLLAEKGEVVARIIERKIPSISEMYGGTSIEAISNDFYDENAGGRIFTIPENHVDIDVDVDFSPKGETKTMELSAEVEAKKAKKEQEKLEKLAAEKLTKFYQEEKEDESEKRVSIIKDLDNIDFSHSNIFVCELNKITDKGACEIRIPLYLYEEMKTFWDGDSFSQIQDTKLKEKFGLKCSFEVIDVASHMRNEGEGWITLESKYLAIQSEVLSEMHPVEKDIVRLIKKELGVYDIELIRKGSKEYEIWENFCIYTMKNSKRKFGVM